MHSFLLRGIDTPSREITHDVEIFTSLPIRGLLLKKRICSLWEQIIFFKSSPFLKVFDYYGGDFLSVPFKKNYPMSYKCRKILYAKVSDKMVCANSADLDKTAILLSILRLYILGKNFSRQHFEIFFLFFLENRIWLIDCVEVLHPSQPNGVMSSAVSLPNHTTFHSNSLLRIWHFI